MNKVNVLVIGSGGREAAMVYALMRSKRLGELYVAPGNGLMPERAIRVPLKPEQVDELADFAQQNHVGLTIVGPEAPLEAGISDLFRKRKLRIFGPIHAAAKLETSKAFAVKVMQEADVPCPITLTFDSCARALLCVKGSAFPLVVKADGLCAGKGVFICRNKAEAEAALRALMVDKVFGAAGEEVLIQEHLQGYELSYHAMCDGRNFKLFPPSQDHKQLLDGDSGGMTGGMGAFAPVPWATRQLSDFVKTRIVRPVLKYMAKAGTPFSGCLYIGLMVTREGPKVLEFNVRMGDPETQVYLRLLLSDFLELCLACATGSVRHVRMSWGTGNAVCVVLAAKGYGRPGVAVSSGDVIAGIEDARRAPRVEVFGAGVRFNELDRSLVTAGGRVLNVTARGMTLDAALTNAYAAANAIHFNGKHMRTDIGRRAWPEFMK